MCLEENKEWKEFKSKLLKLKGHRKHKVTNSLGVYDAYKWIRKNKWLNIGRPLTEHEFYSIIRKINKHLIDNLLDGYDIKLPYRMGTIELRKYEPKLEYKDGKIKNTYPIDWDKTIKLWHQDKESYRNKTLVKSISKEVFKLFYNRNKANYNNKCFYEFNFNRDLKLRLKQKIEDNEIDAFKLS